MSLTVSRQADVSRFEYKQDRSLLATVARLTRWITLYALLLQLAVLCSLQSSQLVQYALPSSLLNPLVLFWRHDPKRYALACGLNALWVFFCYTRPATEESLIVMRSVGLQTSSGGASKFIPLDQIEDVVIHEAFIGFQVKFYLAVLTKDGKVEVIFPQTLPRRHILEEVWRDTLAAIAEE